MTKRKVKRKKYKDYVIKDGVTNSLLNSWLACRQRMAYALDGWQKEGSRRALMFGSLMHDLLEHHYHGEPVVSVCKKWKKDAIAQGLDAQAAEYDVFVNKILLEEYAKFYKKRDAKKVWVGLEAEFDEDFHGYRLRGKRDGLYSIGTSKQVWLFETKTTSQISDARYTKMLNVDAQIRMYSLATKLETGRTPVGTCYNLIRKPQLKRGKEEPLDVFMVRVKADIQKRPEWYFVRYEIKFRKGELNRFAEDLHLKLVNLDLWLNSRSTFRNETACAGLYECEFLDACASGCMNGFKQDRILFEELG